jgi:two-component system sensor histidine kinase CpxA
MKLYWKLSMVLGLAMIVALVAAMWMGSRIGILSTTQFMQAENREPIIERASQALNAGGRESLTAWLRQNRNPTAGWTLLIVDDRNNELLDREIPGYLEGRLRAQTVFRNRFGPSSGPGNRRDRQDFDEITSLNSGETFKFVFLPSRITVLDFLGIPITQVGVVTLAIVVAAMTALLLARSLSSPIVRLQRATRGLAAGALDTRVGQPFVSRKDEIGTLARDFDAMAERLQALITDKEVLLRDVSHELRSPLARIRVALALAQRKADTAAQGDLGRIEQEAEKLDQLVGQILTVSRLRTAPLEEFVDVDLVELLGQVVDNARFEHPDRAIGYEAGDVPTIQGNGSELASAVENVLRNALLHAGPKAEVKVDLARAGDDIVITVADNGPGVPEDQLAYLFEPFYRVDPSRDHKMTGYGLGLAIASSVIQRHGGSIVARNRPEGGLSVTFRLPVEHRT